ncbi:hypothetical protein ACFO26_02195 [Lactococcus nasutitermitis]|uniref:HTH-type transcriptional regulator Rgg C-terminal domain-containing protein n=1 Tax=Lactococcus nasutitermitis TaxID=1652957 RepID=A0ABV9JC92_9LACT|nr:Rgg/GadR/MutR family transcriptional regulator [Lactococcus nasutitermitis]
METSLNAIKERILYSKAFQLVRHQKNIKTTAFESLGVDNSVISRFENGKTLMGIDKIDACLQEMHTSLREYEYMVNGFAEDTLEEAFHELESAYYENNETKIRSIQKEYRNERLIYLSAKAILDGLTEAEQEIIYEDYSQIESLGYAELSAFALIIEHMATDMIMDMMDNFWDKNTAYYKIFSYRRKLLQGSHRAALELSRRGEKKYAKLVLDVTAGILHERDIFSKTMHLFSVGYYLYRFENVEKGKKKMNFALQVFEEVESYRLLGAYQRFYKETVK